MLKRSDKPYNWDLPGGHIEEGESMRHGACREVQEETNISLNPQKLRFLKKATLNKPINFYSSHAKAGNVQLSDEHDAFEWVNPKDLNDYQFFFSSFIDLINDAFQLNEDYQDEVKKKHKIMKIRLIGRGGNINTPPYTKKAPKSRSKSAPAGAGGT